MYISHDDIQLRATTTFGKGIRTQLDKPLNTNPSPDTYNISSSNSKNNSNLGYTFG